MGLYRIQRRQAMAVGKASVGCHREESCIGYRGVRPRVWVKPQCYVGGGGGGGGACKPVKGTKTSGHGSGQSLGVMSWGGGPV